MIKKAKKSDLERIILLYKKIAKVPHGITRAPKEITKNYVNEFLSASLKNGLIFLATNPQNPNQLIAEIHGYKIGPKCFEYCLSNLTLVVDQDFSGQGIGFKIFSKLIEEMKKQFPSIIRIELNARASNKKALGLYQKLGFQVEGYLKNRIVNSKGELEDDTIMS